MRKNLIALCLMFVCGLSIAPCAEQTLIAEGADTKCQVRYSPYKGEHGDMFLKAGDKIAVISPSAFPSKEQVDATVKGLKGWGYVPVMGKHVYGSVRSLADCIADLKWALSDPEIKGIFCVRGGYGASEVMDQIPLEMIASARKPIIGYSDISVYHAGWTNAGLMSIQACMSATFDDLAPECVEVEKNIIRGKIPSYTCEGKFKGKNGEAEGILIGGNLSTFLAVLGTAYDSTKSGRKYILFLEDVEEDVQHIHRYLTVLKHLGVLDRAAGIVFGEWTDIPADLGDYTGSSRGGKYTSVTDMICRQFLDNLDIPAAFGFPAGHSDVNYPLLMGEKVHLKVTDKNFTLSY